MPALVLTGVGASAAAPLGLVCVASGSIAALVAALAGGRRTGLRNLPDPRSQPEDVGDAFAIATVVAVTATPLLRVGWLVFRWSQERDWRFVGTGVGC